MRGLSWVLVILIGGCTAGPAVERPSLSMARADIAQGAPDTAVAIARSVLAVSPHDVPALIVVADAEAAQHRDEDAGRDYRAALALAPGNPEAARGLARLDLARDPAAAETRFRALLAGRPRDAALLTDLGVALDLQGRHGPAQAAYREALRVLPGSVAAGTDLALSLALSGAPAEAEVALRDIATRDAPARARADLAFVQVLNNHRTDAESTLRRDLPAEAAGRDLLAMQTLKAGGL